MRDVVDDVAAQDLPEALLQTNWSGVAIDSRVVQPGDLFVALPGEHTDGHQYVADALRRGAAAALVRRDWAAPSPAIIPVDDPLRVLQTLAARRRRCFDLPVIGITGSVGKTSAKELVAAVLSQRLVTLASVKSFNNELGVPLTLLRLRPEHRAIVLEMGAYGPGDIAFLCRLARPQYGIELNVGASHLERMRTYETVAAAKAELVEALPPDGLAILNGDDPRVRAMRDQTRARTLLFGRDANNDLWADQIESRGLDGIAFTAHMDGEQRRLDLPLPGRHNVYNALAAIAVARELQFPWETIAAGLRAATARSRLVVREGRNGSTLLDDSYNAAPVSCQAALDLLAELPGRRIAVFGAMAELGPEEIPGHRAVGRAAAGTVDLLVVVGPKARYIGEAALETRDAPEVVFTHDNDAASAFLRDRLRPGDYVLVKGARVAATEAIVQALLREVDRSSSTVRTRDVVEGHT